LATNLKHQQFNNLARSVARQSSSGLSYAWFYFPRAWQRISNPWD